MEIATIILSILAILGSIFVYFSHDKKIKKQEKILNDYQIKRFESEDIENKKAEIKGNIRKRDKGLRTLIVFNSGKNTAYNIRLEFLSELNGIIDLEFQSYEMLNPQESTEICFFLVEGHAPTLKVKYIWNDNFRENNEFAQILTL